jgi:hypothetical protein
VKLNEEYFIKNSTLTFKYERGFFLTDLQGPRRFFILFVIQAKENKDLQII